MKELGYALTGLALVISINLGANRIARAIDNQTKMYICTETLINGIYLEGCKADDKYDT